MITILFNIYEDKCSITMDQHKEYKANLWTGKRTGVDIAECGYLLLIILREELMVEMLLGSFGQNHARARVKEEVGEGD